MALSDVEIRKAKPREKEYKLYDERGLYLLAAPNGSLYWRFKYQFGGEKKLAFGVYPEVGLKDARMKRDDARRSIDNGIDPGITRKREKLMRNISPDETLEGVARDWHEKNKARWNSKHGIRIVRWLEGDVFPSLGKRRISEITAPELLAVLTKIEERDALDIAHRVRAVVSEVFLFAIAHGKAQTNIAAGLHKAMKVRKKNTGFAHLQEDELPDFLRKLDRYDGEAQTRRALQIAIYTLVRTTELRGAKWPEFDFKKAMWEIPAARMKMREKHLVPLSRQVVELLKEQHELTGNCEYVFPNGNRTSQCMSENAMLYAIYRLGYHSRATTHGFRKTASTILNEASVKNQRRFDKDYIERQLAHGDRDEIRDTYNYAEYRPQRVVMMQWWADRLDETKKRRTKK
jgi:integrase